MAVLSSQILTFCFTPNYYSYKYAFTVDSCFVFLCIAAVPSGGELRTFNMDRSNIKNAQALFCMAIIILRFHLIVIDGMFVYAVTLVILESLKSWMVYACLKL